MHYQCPSVTSLEFVALSSKRETLLNRLDIGSIWTTATISGRDALYLHIAIQLSECVATIYIA